MILLTSKKRQIYAQGDIDGACFLYSILNAYVALTGMHPDFELICCMVADVKFPGDFLTGNVGTQANYKKIEHMIPSTIKSCLDSLGDANFSVEKIECCDISHVAKSIDDSHVVLIHYKGDSKYLHNMNHWVCGVETSKTEKIIHVACSVILQKIFTHYDSYSEVYHIKYDRWSNDILTEQTSIVTDAIYKIGLIK